MILNFSRPSVGAQVGSGNVVAFGPASQGQAPLPAVVGTGFQNPILTATHPRLIRFGFSPVGTLGQVSTRPAVGSIGGGRGRRRITREELDRRLKEQRDNTFGRRWFDEFLAAKESAKEAAAEADNKAQRKALAKAAKAAERVREEVDLSDTVPDLEPLTLALDAAASATRVKDALLSAKLAIDLANAMVAAIRHAAEQQDEDEALTLLLLQ